MAVAVIVHCFRQFFISLPEFPRTALAHRHMHMHSHARSYARTIITFHSFAAAAAAAAAAAVAVAATVAAHMVNMYGRYCFLVKYERAL